jgi:16S rRNA (cytosine967-C5)-methyltransferase
VRQVEKGETYASALLDKHLSAIARANDQALCTELVYGTLRWHGALKASIERACERKTKIDPAIWPHLLVAAYQLQHLSERIPTHAAVNEAVKAVKKIRPGLAGFANAILRRLGSPTHLLLKSENISAKDLADAFFVPLQLCERICQLLPKAQWISAVAAMNDRPLLYMRRLTNEAEKSSITTDTTHPILPKQLPWVPISAGMAAASDAPNPTEQHAFVPGAFRLTSPAPGSLEDMLRVLHAVVQDPGSQTVALLVDAQPGDVIVDMCAAPGTKSMVLKAAVGDKGQVIACDISAERSKRIEQNADRLGLPVAVVVGDASKQNTLQALQNKASRVLIDAPCSGLGTLRRHPETRFREPSLEEHSEMQLKLLQAGALLVKKGGVLVYSVCTPMREEGEDVVALFLKKHTDFKRKPVREVLSWLPESGLTPKGDLLLWPHLHDADAFYAACLIRMT